MDVFTHGLLGAAIGRLGSGRDAATARAAAWAATVAALVADLDVFYGRGEMLAEFKYHRGLTHSFFVAPLLAAAVAGVLRLVFRQARWGPLYAFSLLALVFGHILPDLWTGWGTMALLPLSAARLGLDWVSIVDPLLTGTLVVALLWARRRPDLRRRAAAAGLALVYGYVALRGVQAAVLWRQVAARYPDAGRVAVWPGLNPLGAWRYAADLRSVYATGTVGPAGGVVENGRVQTGADLPGAAALRQSPELAPLLRFARFPVVRTHPQPDGTLALSVWDLRYNYARYDAVLNGRLEVVRLEVDRARLP